MSYPIASFADQVFEVLRDNPERLIKLIREQFYLDVSCTGGDSWDGPSVTVELRSVHQQSWDKPILSSTATLPSP